MKKTVPTNDRHCLLACVFSKRKRVTEQQKGRAARLCRLLHFVLSANLFLDFCRLTDSVTKIIELASADFTVSDMLNLGDIG